MSESNTSDRLATEIHRDIEAVAAEDYAGDDKCSFDDCDELAVWTVEFQGRGKSTTSNICQSCSIANRIYARENELYENEISEAAR